MQLKDFHPEEYIAYCDFLETQQPKPDQVHSSDVCWTCLLLIVHEGSDGDIFIARRCDATSRLFRVTWDGPAHLVLEYVCTQPRMWSALLSRD